MQNKLQKIPKVIPTKEQKIELYQLLCNQLKIYDELRSSGMTYKEMAKQLNQHVCTVTSKYNKYVRAKYALEVLTQ